MLLALRLLSGAVVLVLLQVQAASALSRVLLGIFCFFYVFD